MHYGIYVQSLGFVSRVYGKKILLYMYVWLITVNTLNNMLLVQGSRQALSYIITPNISQTVTFTTIWLITLNVYITEMHVFQFREAMQRVMNNRVRALIKHACVRDELACFHRERWFGEFAPGERSRSRTAHIYHSVKERTTRFLTISAGWPGYIKWILMFNSHTKIYQVLYNIIAIPS